MSGTSGLDPEQRAAVEAVTGGLFISAGAGSGKTRILTERFARLVREGGDDASALDRVAAITFTDRAAGELAERIRACLSAQDGGPRARRVEAAWIGTIHGTCARLLRRHALAAGLDPAFRVLDEIEQGAVSHVAFEEAVRGSAPARELATEYGAEELERSVTAIAEQLRSMGVDRGGVRVPAADPAPAVREAAVSLAGVASRLAPHTRTATAAGNAERLAETVAALEGWRHAPGAAEELLVALSGFKQRRSGSAAVKALADEACAAAADVSAALIDAVCHSRALTFLELLGDFARLYGAAKEERGVLDFADLQTRALALMEDDPVIAESYRSRFAEIMVDEFQDTDALQLRLVDALSGGRASTVGDERQSIYSFRNADVEVFRRRAAAMPAERSVPLSRNYRSHRDILDFLNAMFTREPFWTRGFQRLEAGSAAQDRTPDGWPEDVPRVSVHFVDAAVCAGGGRVRHEAEALAGHLAHLRDIGAARAGEMVVLLRAMTNAGTFSEALASRGFEVSVASGATYFETAEAEELEALVRVLANASDDEAFTRLLAGRMVGLSDDGLALLRMHAGALDAPERDRASLWDAAKDSARAALPGPDEEVLSEAVRVLAAARLRRVREPLSETLLRACREFDHDLALFAAGEPRAWGNVMKFARMAEAHERLTPGDPGGFLEHLRARRDHGRGDAEAATVAEGTDSVRIMSVHAAKGLDLPVVAVAGLGRELSAACRGHFVLSSDADGPLLGVSLPDIEPFADARGAAWREVAEGEEIGAAHEERRILYVACTRAMRALVLSGVVDSRKEPQDACAADWVRRALGLGEGFAGGRIECGIEVPVDVHGAVEGRGPRAAPRAPSPAQDVSAALARESLEEGDPGPVRSLAQVSYSALQTYRDCAYRHFVEHVLRIPAVSRPGSARMAAARFGDAFHGLVLASGPSGPDGGRLDAIARAAGLDAAGVERLRRAADAFFSSDVLARALDGERVSKEAGFVVDLDGTLLHGAIDMVAWRSDEALILDYKTGVHDPDERSLERYRLQGACYALAAIRSGASRVSVEFVQVEKGCRTTHLEWIYEEGDAIAADLRVTTAAMRAGVFEPLDAFSEAVCPACPALGGLCPVSRPGAG